jgi:hypothetical protein
MRKQFLWLGKAGFHYPGPGNISIASGAKGSVFFWWHPHPSTHSNMTLWEATGNASNYLKLYFSSDSRLTLQLSWGTGGRDLHWNGFQPAEHNFWVPVTCTWDFTVPGQGKLRLYVDGAEAPAQINDAQGTLIDALTLRLGPTPGDVSAPLDGCLDNFTVWDGVMTKTQHDALRGDVSTWALRQSSRRHVPQESDGSGVMTLRAGFDGSYDAEIAGGDGTAAWQVEPANYDQFCRLDDGSSGRGKRHQFFFGMPRHDNTPDDRVPIQAVLLKINAFGSDAYTALTNHTDHSEIQITQVMAPSGQGQGLGWLREWVDPDNLMRPGTIRMRVNVPSATNPIGTKISLGPLCYINGGMHGNNFGTWGTGELFTVVSDSGNSATSFKTNLSAQASNYWVGAELSLRSGVNAACRLKVAGYNPATGFVTLSGALQATPAAGDMGLVDFRGRLIPNGTPPNETQSLEAWLWEEYSTDRPWIEIECVYCFHSGLAFTRLQRGRTCWMELTDQRSTFVGNNIMFGRNAQYGVPSSYSCDILLESLIVEGPGGYQVMSPEPCALGRGFDLGDTFAVVNPSSAHSSRVWRWLNCRRQVKAPTLQPAGTLVNDLAAANTWRHTASYMNMVLPHEGGEACTAFIYGANSAGTGGYGYVTAAWDEALGKIRWTEETPPPGRSNPIVTAEELHPWATRDSSWGIGGIGGLRTLGMSDGTWALMYYGTEGNPDHYYTRLLHGAEDRWSFDFEKQWWPENPVLPGNGGVDKIGPEYGGINLFGNRDAEWVMHYNRFAREPHRRYFGYARFKTLVPLNDALSSNRRLLAGWSSGDLKSFFLLPHGNMLGPLPAGDHWRAQGYMMSDDVMGLIIGVYGGYVQLWASDDDQHFQQVHSAFLPNGGPGEIVDLGDQRVFFYYGSEANYGMLGLNRETDYELNDGQTEGWVETAILNKPKGGWGKLSVNLNPENGRVRVAVIEAQTEREIAGFGAGACDLLAEGVSTEATWGSVGLQELTAESIRLRFTMTRTLATDATPKLYAWSIERERGVMRPESGALQVEGHVNPAGVGDATPNFSWTYSDGKHRPQAAYQILVASSQEVLEANQGNVWDSGVVSSSQHEAAYGGPSLGDNMTYFWKVRVRNSEGVWSEEW